RMLTILGPLDAMYCTTMPVILPWLNHACLRGSRPLPWQLGQQVVVGVDTTSGTADGKVHGLELEPPFLGRPELVPDVQAADNIRNIEAKEAIHQVIKR